MKTPIAVFAYRRPVYLGRCLAALARCARLDECQVTIYSDGARAEADRGLVEEVRQIARLWAQRYGAEVREAPENRGLARSIVDGVTELCGTRGRVIVLEDDLEPAPDLLVYMLAALDHWNADSRVMQIAGHRLPFPWGGKDDAFFLPCTTTWGWATWQRAWEKFTWEPTDAAALEDQSVAREFDLGGVYPYSQMLRDRLAGRNDSWGILWWWAVFRAGGQVLYPRESLIAVGGFDGSGTHCGPDGTMVEGQQVGTFSHVGAQIPAAARTDPEALQALCDYLRVKSPRRRRLQRWWRRVFAPLSVR